MHDVMRTSKDHGCDLVPLIHSFPEGEFGGVGVRGKSTFTVDGGHWEMLQWKRGEPARADATLDAIRDGAAAIAQFHASTRCLGIETQPPPAVRDRLTRAQALDSLVPQALEHSSRGVIIAPEMAKEIHDACQTLRWNWPQARQRIARSLRQYDDLALPTQFVLRDVHRDHVLFHDGRVEGLIDFDAVRIDTPVTDLSRWVGSFLLGRKNNRGVWEAALAGFCNENTLKSGQQMEIDPKMAKDLCFANTWISLANWLVWLLCEQRTFPPGPAVVANRIRELVALTTQEEGLPG